MNTTSDAIRSSVDFAIKNGYGFLPIKQPSFNFKLLSNTMHYLALKPEDVLEKWLIDLSGKDDPDHGFIRRRGDGSASEDYKDFFHYTPEVLPLLKRRNVPIETGQHRFFEELYAITGWINDQAIIIAEHLNALLPGYDFENKFFDMRQSELQKLRLLLYKEVALTNKFEIADEHTDRGAISFPLFQSQPGLEFFVAGKWTAIEQLAQPGQLFFFGKKMQLYTGGSINYYVHGMKKDGTPKIKDRLNGGLIQAMPHRVIGDGFETSKKRFSVVSFTHFQQEIPEPSEKLMVLK